MSTLIFNKIDLVFNLLIVLFERVEFIFQPTDLIQVGLFLGLKGLQQSRLPLNLARKKVFLFLKFEGFNSGNFLFILDFI